MRCFKIPKNESFVEKTLYLSEHSKELYLRGRPGQGYIGIVNIYTGEIFLYPAFNKDDGQVAIDINGTPFDDAIRSRDKLGGSQQDLHNKAVDKAGLLEIGGVHGGIIGFGIWKSGCGIRIGSESLLAPKALIPNEYILINKSGHWQIMYVDSKYSEPNDVLNVENLTSSFPQLDEIMERYSETKMPEGLDENAQLIWEKNRRQEIEESIRRFHQDRKEIDKIDAAAKFVKNRSTSQNGSSIHYCNGFLHYFRISMNLDSARGATHEEILPREAPTPIFQNIMDAICHDLGKRKIDVTTNPTVDRMVLRHLSTGDYWESEYGWSDLPSQSLLLEIIPYKSKSKVNIAPTNIHLIEQCLAHDEVDPNFELTELNLSSLGLTGRTALTEAIECENYPVIEVLINHSKIDPNRSRSFDHETPLTLAIKRGDITAVRLLLINNKTNVMQSNNKHEDPLILAANNPEILAILKEHVPTKAATEIHVLTMGLFADKSEIADKEIQDQHSAINPNATKKPT